MVALFYWFGFFQLIAWGQTEFPGTQCQNVRLSVSQADSNGESSSPDLSADGRYVVFKSEATNLGVTDTNGVIADIVLLDRQTQQFQYLSSPPNHPAANANSHYPAITGNGVFVTFTSEASNLVTGDTNNSNDVFLTDIYSGNIQRVGLTNSGVEANGESFKSTVSEDGNTVAFLSMASNLVAGDTNNRTDAFVRILSGANLGTYRISPTPSSGVTFDVRDVQLAGNGSAAVFWTQSALSGEASFFADVYWVDLSHLPQVPAPILVSHQPRSRAPGNLSSTHPSISGDGQRVVFASEATNLVSGDQQDTSSDIFVWEASTGVNRKLRPPIRLPRGSWAPNYTPRISRNGRWVSFTAFAHAWFANVSRSEKDVILYDLDSDTFALASPHRAPNPDDEMGSGTDDTQGVSVSDDGSKTIFVTSSNQLVTNWWTDRNMMRDIYLYDCTMPSYPGSCFGDGTSGTCPNQSLSASGNGCASATVPQGARLEALGFASLSKDHFSLKVTGLPPNTPFILMASLVSATTPVPLGAGLSCAGSSFASTQILQSAATETRLGYGSNMLQPLGSYIRIPLTQVRYQVVFLDWMGQPMPGNTTNAVDVTWLP